MLPKENRLNIRTYYSEFRGTGKKLYHPLFSLYYRLQNNDQTPKVNVIVSKKVAKEAVKRNRMRRLIHTAAANLLTNLPPGFEGLFFIHKDFTELDSTQLTADIKQMLLQGNIYQDDK